MNFEFLAGNLALDFTNTVHSHGADDPRDDMKALPDLLAWGHQAGLLRQAELRRPGPGLQHDFQRALVQREVFYEIFAAIAARGEANGQDLQRLALYFRAAMSHTTIERSGEHYQLGWGGARPLERMLYELTRSAVNLLFSGKLGRVRQCAGETCSWLFLDTSRNGTRRWCDMRACGNRAKVRRFRRRA